MILIDNLYIYRIYSWLVVWNHGMLWLSIIILGISSSQLTNSIIFQRGRSTTNQICIPFVHLYGKSVPLGFPTNMGWYTGTSWEPFVPYQWSMARRVKRSWIPSSPSRTWLHAGNGTNGTTLVVLGVPSGKFLWHFGVNMGEPSRRKEIMIWVCLKMLCTPLYPMVLLIIIPMKNGYFIGNIQYFQTNPYRHFGPFISGILHTSACL